MNNLSNRVTPAYVNNMMQSRIEVISFYTISVEHNRNALHKDKPVYVMQVTNPTYELTYSTQSKHALSDTVTFQRTCLEAKGLYCT